MHLFSKTVATSICGKVVQGSSYPKQTSQSKGSLRCLAFSHKPWIRSSRTDISSRVFSTSLDPKAVPESVRSTPCLSVKLLITELNATALPSICCAIGKLEIAPNMELRRALAEQLDACVGDMKTDELLLCLKTLLRTEEQKDSWASDRIIRRVKGIIWGRSINLKNIVNNFEEMAPNVSSKKLLDLFECSVELGISTTSLLQVILMQLSDHFRLRQETSATKKQSLARDRWSPESVGLILRSVEICQLARITASKHEGLSCKYEVKRKVLWFSDLLWRTVFLSFFSFFWV